MKMLSKENLLLWFKRGALISVIMIIVAMLEGVVGLSAWSIGFTDFKVIGAIILLVNWIVLGYVATFVCDKVN